MEPMSEADWSHALANRRRLIADRQRERRRWHLAWMALAVIVIFTLAWHATPSLAI